MDRSVSVCVSVWRWERVHLIQQNLQQGIWCSVQVNLLHLKQRVPTFLFFPVHVQHSPLFCLDLLAVVSESGASVGAADEAWKSITIAAAAGVRGSLRLLMISADSRFFPNTSKKSLLLYVLAWFQEGSTAVKSTNELKAETSIML